MNYTTPAAIENQSMALITQELAQRGVTLPPEISPILLRVIHTTADFDYVDTLRFTPQAPALGKKALGEGVPLITDTNMALAGISKRGLAQVGCEAFCYVTHPEVVKAAQEGGTTRAAAAVAFAAKRHPRAIFTVGNAPTALLELVRQMDQGLRPALIIGVPVGFVNVVEGKEAVLTACEKYGVPAIVALGRKGGSTVAAAICNALLYGAGGMLDPRQRGWR